jgi:hypothetical protein
MIITKILFNNFSNLLTTQPDNKFGPGNITSVCSAGSRPIERECDLHKSKKEFRTSKEQNSYYNPDAPFVWLYKTNWIFMYPL